MKFVYFLCLALLNIIYVQSQTYKIITDPRDSITYGTVTYENILPDGKSMTWFSDNLLFEMDGSHIRTEDKRRKNRTYNSHGRLHRDNRYYTWEAALIACPEGWHLPSFDEWDFIVNKFGGINGAKWAFFDYTYDYKGRPNYLGYPLSPDEAEALNKSKLNMRGRGRLRGPNPDNKTSRGDQGGTFHWTSTSNDEETAWFISMDMGNQGIIYRNYKKSNWMCIRCVKDYE